VIQLKHRRKLINWKWKTTGSRQRSFVVSWRIGAGSSSVFFKNKTVHQFEELVQFGLNWSLIVRFSFHTVLVQNQTLSITTWEKKKCIPLFSKILLLLFSTQPTKQGKDKIIHSMDNYFLSFETLNCIVNNNLKLPEEMLL